MRATLVAVCMSVLGVLGLAAATPVVASATPLKWSAPYRLDPGQGPAGLSCPAAGQCTAVDNHREVTFDPRRIATHRFRTLSKGPDGFGGLACASRDLCVAAVGGRAVRFDPRRFRGVRRTKVASFTITDLRCPTAHECVAIGSTNPRAVSFNPTNGRIIHRPFTIETPYQSVSLVALACPSARQCTAVDSGGGMVTFQPRTGRRISHAIIDHSVINEIGPSQYSMDGVTCVGTRLCVATDSRGDVVHFDPRAHGPGRVVSVDPGGMLTAIACSSSRQCTVGDEHGRVFTGDPRGRSWSLTQLGTSASITSIACRSNGSCVAVDAVGDVFTARR